MSAASIQVGLRSAPYLADHAVQDSVLLPGSFYVATALRLERELFQRAGAGVRNAVFHSPVVLSAEDTRLEVDLSVREDGIAEYVFREGGAVAATLEVAQDTAVAAAAFRPDDARTKGQAGLYSAEYYAALRANGNQYGPHLQGISRLWRAGEESLALIELPRASRELGPGARQTILLDSATQMLASLVLDQGRTFLLRSIAAIEGGDGDVSGRFWGHARLRAANGASGKEHVGDVQLIDSSGRPVLRLSGVAFTLSERTGEAAATLAIAANFTAEPLEDSLRFWGAHFGLPLQTIFAPYNQVFQQLLDPRSALSRNRDGVNVVLLALEEWAAQSRGTAALTSERADECLGALERTVLPNGLQIAHLHAHETGYLYEEIFEDQCYLRHGIALEKGDTVVDVGANIGMFSLFIQSRCPGARIYAFEPAPAACEVLRANLAAYAPNARVFDAGVADKAGTATFTYYGKASVFSGFHAETHEDGASLKAIVSNMLQRESAAGEVLEEYAEEIVADRLVRSEHQCRLTSISEFMRENGVERINLLKIDAEKSEAAILAGIAEKDWAKIDQLVIEVHDPSGEAAPELLERLRQRGYRCTLDQPQLLRRAGLCSVYATRRVARAGSAREAAQANLQRNVDDFCAALRTHMERASAPLVLCICPPSRVLAEDAEIGAALADAEHALLKEAGALASVRTLAPSALRARYPLDAFHDPEAARAGHIPFTPGGFAVLGTALMRTVYGLKRRPFKVIALDCDNTLWTGVCGEDGPGGLELCAARRGLHEFMLAQMQAGMLLCLCSKNNERDVLDVFERRGADMPLKLADFAARRLNWQSKPENLEALAAELGVGLDSFIFVDDDPVECAQVRRRCPAVLTLQLPRERDAIGAFLDHVWAFDRSAATDEDRGRTRMVQENAQRKEFRASAQSLKDFIHGLGLTIEIAPAGEAELGRIAQLIARTNQFSLITRRRSEGELRQFLARAGAGCAAVRVSDRFGDYGLVGAILHEPTADSLRVDSLLLSCRALGRGVEHAMAAWVGRHALAQGRRSVEIAYWPTARNQPAQEFIAAIGGPKPGDTQKTWSVAAERLAGIAYAPAEAEAPEITADRAGEKAAASAWDFSSKATAHDLRTVDKLVEAIEAHERVPETLPAAASPAQADSLEGALAAIWAKVLGRGQVGLHDNFFDAGGTSLKAVRVVAMVKKELGKTLQVVSLLECPTVALLAARLGVGAQASTPAAGDAALRGQRRRNKHQTQRTLT